MDFHHRHNNIVSPQLVLESTADNHRIVSSTDNNIFPPPFLPTELIVEILLRLPVKSLLQFKCVCKLWKTVISNPQFAKQHLVISTHQRLTILVSTTYNHKSLSYSYPLRPLSENPSTRVIPDILNDEYRLLGSCNGLFCLFDEDQWSVIMYNPSINYTSKNSPKILSSSTWLIRYNGLGYDHVNDKFKVLVMLKNEPYQPYNDEILTQIYTFGEDSWRNIHNFPCTPYEYVGKYVRGTLNWVGYKVDFGSLQNVILSFDVEKETYREVLLPQNVGDGYVRRYLLYVLSNCLCVCFETETHWVLWLMKEYGVVESWTKLTIIPCENFFWDSSLSIVFISENDIVLLIDRMCSKLMLYNLNNGRWNYTFISLDHLMSLHAYRENLISPRW